MTWATPVLWIGSVALALFAVDRLLLWTETRGWIYWRKTKRKTSGLGAGLMQLNTIFDPSTTHAVEVRQEREVEEKKNGDDDAQRPPGDSIS